MATLPAIETTRYLTACPKLLGLLGQFHPFVPGWPPLEARVIDPATMPEPYHRLLVHASDMTSTLGAYYGEEFQLRVMDRVVARAELARHVVLVGRRSGRLAEYGAIRIHLDPLEGPVRNEVLHCRTPLGGILRAHGVPFRSCPGAFFQICSTESIQRALGLDRAQWLYGRCNCITTPGDGPIAEVVEILPP